MEYVAGLDGGGTKTAVAIADAAGRIVHTFVSGAINFNGHHEAEIEANVRQMMRTIASHCGGGLDACVHICIGAAGVSNPAVREKLERLVRTCGYRGGTTILGDHETALYGAHGRPYGMILIAGTGSICFGVNEEGRKHRTGGFGHLFDDEGSGYSIGRALISAVFKAGDGRAPATVITELVFARLGIGSIEQLVGYAYDPQRSKKDIAALAPILIDACAQGDPSALAIARSAARSLVELVGPVAETLDMRDGDLALAGGVLQHNVFVQDAFKDALRRTYPNLRCMPAKHDASYGAVLAALNQWNGGRMEQG
jgi:N-acetylglucosamine kinase-like BadF-type ATPase